MQSILRMKQRRSMTYMLCMTDAVLCIMRYMMLCHTRHDSF